jgi:hypothetical protein
MHRLYTKTYIFLLEGKTGLALSLIPSFFEPVFLLTFLKLDFLSSVKFEYVYIFISIPCVTISNDQIISAMD